MPSSRSNRIALAAWLLGLGCLAALATGCSVKNTGIAGPGNRDGSGGEGDGDAPAVSDGPGPADGPMAGPDGPDQPPETDGPPGPAPTGSACDAAGACASGFCVDGVCCDGACTGVCEACDRDGKRGSCGPSAGAPRGDRPGCLGQGTPCAGTCDGVAGEACHYPGGTECAAARCSDGVAVAHSVCSEAGTCVAGATISCSPFTCDGAVCAGGCSVDRPCESTHYCSGGRCFPKLDNGGLCDGAEGCKGGACVDGRCCAQASCGTCAACTGAAGACVPVTQAPDPDSCTGDRLCNAQGQCRRVNGQSCQATTDCLSGFCVGGRCCDSACSGACQTCSQAGALGQCRTRSFAGDPENCGRCGNACSTAHINPTCSNGNCGGRCQAGWNDCNADPGRDGCETHIAEDAGNCGVCGRRCPGTRCLAGACEKIVFSWSAAGAIANLTCVPIAELADPHTWNDNFLCTPRNFGLRWSSAGVIAGMVCTQWLEGSDPFTWNDNYLCAPVDYGLRWSSFGPIAGMRCTQILEPADPHTWNDNYLCAPP